MKLRLLLFILGITSIPSMAQTLKQDDFYLIVGTYTNEAKTNGIHVYSFDVQNGKVTEKSVTTDITNPSFVALSKDGNNLYAVSEARDGKGIHAYSFDRTTGKLTFLNSGSVGGSGPCYVTVDEKKQWVFTANYGSGSLSATRLNKDGSLSEDTQFIQHEGHSVNSSRQDKPHVHAVVLSPDERFLLVPDLGTDHVNVYRFNPADRQPLTPANPGFASVNPGGGPRHLAFHPNAKYAYLVLEMEGAVVAFDYKDGKLTEKQRISMLAPGFTGKVGAADIHISPDGKFLYASNRGEANDIAIYSIGKDGKLAVVGRESSGIDNPRNFAIDPTGTFLLVANQNGNDITIFRRDKKTGMLSSTGKTIQVDKPVCLKFVSLR